MRKILFIAGILGLTLTANGEEMIDPFLNPILIKEQALIKVKKNKRKVLEKVKLFKPRINVPLNKLKIQGIIENNGKHYLVFLNPETEETFLLTEGEPITPNEKIEKITNDSVVIIKYRKLKGKLVKEKFILNVDKEGLNND